MKSLTPDVSRHPYYIYTPGYMRTSAGIRCLHLLCHWLNRSGERAFVHIAEFFDDCAEFNPDLITPPLSKSVVERHKDQGVQPIVVYPEIVVGNPTGAACVIRFVLNYPGLLGGDAEYAESELVFAYSRELASKCGDKAGVLHMPVVDLLTFNKGEPRPKKGACYYASKYQHIHKQQVFGLPDNAVEITRDLPDSQSPTEIAEIFRSSEIFYCFENTALAMEAILCGCPVVCMPNDFFEKPISLQEIGWNGSAWGTSEAEIERARNTIDAGIASYMKTIDIFFDQLTAFIEATQKKAVASAAASQKNSTSAAPDYFWRPGTGKGFFPATQDKGVKEQLLDRRDEIGATQRSIDSLVTRHVLLTRRSLKRFLPLNKQLDLVRKSIFFDPEWYVERYGDVPAHMDPAKHYLCNGRTLGRDPGPAFSSFGYLELNPDVLATNFDPLVHFERYGKFEGCGIRISSPCATPMVLERLKSIAMRERLVRKLNPRPSYDFER